MKKILIAFSLLIFIALPLFQAEASSSQWDLIAAVGGSSEGSAGGSSEGSAGGSSEIDISLTDPLGVPSLAQFFFKILNFILSFSYAIIAFFLIWSGFKFVVAQGNEDKLRDAKDSFKYTIIGAILVIGAQVIVEVVKNILTGIQ
jgi:hypothetical protein